MFVNAINTLNISKHIRLFEVHKLEPISSLLIGRMLAVMLKYMYIHATLKNVQKVLAHVDEKDVLKYNLINYSVDAYFTYLAQASFIFIYTSNNSVNLINEKYQYFLETFESNYAQLQPDIVIPSLYDKNFLIENGKAIP